jgi:hypothetical protein
MNQENLVHTQNWWVLIFEKISLDQKPEDLPLKEHTLDLDPTIHEPANTELDSWSSKGSITYPLYWLLRIKLQQTKWYENNV